MTAQDRVEQVAAEEELRSANPRRQAHQSPLTAPPSPPTRLAADYKLLGVNPDADLDAVEAAWRALATRADPKRFPAGSAEEKKAAEILDAVNDAYTRIREELNPTEGRFGQLEL